MPWFNKQQNGANYVIPLQKENKFQETTDLAQCLLHK